MTANTHEEPGMQDLTSPAGDLEPIERASADELRALQRTCGHRIHSALVLGYCSIYQLIGCFQ